MLNPTCDLHGTASGSTTDNADSYDMTPNNTIKDETGADIPSPYQAVWDNDALEDWLELQYVGAPGSLDEQPGSTSSGNMSRGVKLYDDGNPDLNTANNTTGNLCSRRIYQRVNGLTVGTQYTFSVEMRSEAAGTPVEMYILNTEIADEVGINTNGGSDAVVDGFLNYTNTALDTWETATFSFTASDTFAVVYLRSLNTTGGADEVFFDNFSLTASTASIDDFSIANVKMYPNPASDVLTIETTNGMNIATVEVFDILGKEIMNTPLQNNTLNVSELTQGLYLVKMTSDEGTSISQKLVIE
ncbi:MAG: T9SS type A sorting domain-containing protein [Nonlabens sp.]|uniref:T9SS type A sorting domain-containing protein n=1 Tax=Nonlabens sp. TaxID=1888209 RepID=UPI003EF10B3F